MAIQERRAAPERRLRIEGMANFRDLGGYPTRDGGETAWGKIYRADLLHRLTPATIERLMALPIRVACDLRTPWEVERSPNAFVGHAAVAYHHCQIALPAPDDPLLQVEGVDRNIPVYLHMLERSGDSFRAIFGRLADPEAYPLVFHCAAGKDRTGVVAAVILLAAGVERETVIADYLETFTHKDDLGAKLNAEILIHPDAMNAVLDRIEQHYGSVEDFLRAQGVGDEQIASFREQFVVRPAAP